MMKIGIIADGQAEAQALQHLMDKLARKNLQFLRPVYADMQPYAPLAQIVRASESRISLLGQRGADRYIVLLDRESNEECPGEFAARLQGAFSKGGHERVKVVLKNRAFENWLIGDPRAFCRGAHRRIEIADRVIQRIESAGSDGVNALAVLNGCVAAGYNKRSDAIEICKMINPEIVGKNSRSFRKLLKEIG